MAAEFFKAFIETDEARSIRLAYNGADATALAESNSTLMFATAAGCLPIDVSSLSAGIPAPSSSAPAGSAVDRGSVMWSRSRCSTAQGKPKVSLSSRVSAAVTSSIEATAIHLTMPKGSGNNSFNSKKVLRYRSNVVSLCLTSD